MLSRKLHAIVYIALEIIIMYIAYAKRRELYIEFLTRINVSMEWRCALFSMLYAIKSN